MGSAAILVVVLVPTVAPVIAGWALWLALVTWGRAGWEWGLFGEPEVPPDAWSAPVVLLVALAACVLTIAFCIGLPMLVGLADRSDQPESTRRRRRRTKERLGPVVLLAAAGSFGVLLSTTHALLLVEWAEDGFAPRWPFDLVTSWPVV